jgi:hypothetical protein
LYVFVFFTLNLEPVLGTIALAAKGESPSIYALRYYYLRWHGAPMPLRFTGGPLGTRQFHRVRHVPFVWVLYING